MEKNRLNRELMGVIVSVTALVVIVSLFSYTPRDPSFNTSSRYIDVQNRVGIIGSYLADTLLQGFGFAAYLLPVLLCIVAFQLFRSGLRGVPLGQVVGYGMLVISMAVILDLFIDSDTARDGGGIIGGFLKESVLIPLFGQISATLISLTALLVSVMLLTQSSLLYIVNQATRNFGEFKKSLVPAANAWFKELREKKRRKGENTKKERRDYVPPPILLKEEVTEEPDSKTAKKPPVPQQQFKLPEIGEGYKLPPPELLDPPDGEQFKIDKETLHANSLILQKKLADFGVEGEVVAVRPGPVITMYEFKPAPGVKVRRIVLLADDLAMALRAVSVR
ncbi:MAG TPA: DNA translocase FtsK 4TM domain-containing protein, partial [Candidatus Udaeobacter sp.]|nr:DNA translocase FtsK 4TM domain-containing protein [Candidatus Udaeobacter sp.]